MGQGGKRIESLIRKNVSDILQFEVTNSSIGFVTVTDVRMNADGKSCKVFVSFLGTTHPEKNMESLKNSAGYIKASLAKKMDLYKVPKLFFVLDDSYEKHKKIDDLIKKEKEELENMKK